MTKKLTICLVLASLATGIAHAQSNPWRGTPRADGGLRGQQSSETTCHFGHRHHGHGNVHVRHCVHPWRNGHGHFHTRPVPRVGSYHFAGLTTAPYLATPSYASASPAVVFDTARMIEAIGHLRAKNAEAVKAMVEARILQALAEQEEVKLREANAKERLDRISKHRDWVEKEKSRRPPITQERLNARAERLAPSRLTSIELASGTGEIAWPELLLQGEFATQRAELEWLFAARAAGIRPAIGASVESEVAAALTTLHAKIREVSPMSYVEAKNFLRSLAYETRFPVQASEVAAAQ